MTEATFVRKGLFWLTVEGCSHHSGRSLKEIVTTHPHLMTEKHKCMLSVFSLFFTVTGCLDIHLLGQVVICIYHSVLSPLKFILTCSDSI